MLILIAVLSLPQLPAGYYEVPLEVRVNYGVFYLGSAGFLAIMTYQLHGLLGGI